VVKPGCGVCGSVFARLAAVFEAVALAVHFHDVDVVGQSIEKCTCEAFGAEGAGPFVERQVGDVTTVDPRS
jgi:hypothetical protein